MTSRESKTLSRYKTSVSKKSEEQRSGLQTQNTLNNRPAWRNTATSTSRAIPPLSNIYSTGLNSNKQSNQKNSTTGQHERKAKTKVSNSKTINSINKPAALPPISKSNTVEKPTSAHNSKAKIFKKAVLPPISSPTSPNEKKRNQTNVATASGSGGKKLSTCPPIKAPLSPIKQGKNTLRVPSNQTSKNLNVEVRDGGSSLNPPRIGRPKKSQIQKDSSIGNTSATSKPNIARSTNSLVPLPPIDKKRSAVLKQEVDAFEARRKARVPTYDSSKTQKKKYGIWETREYQYLRNNGSNTKHEKIKRSETDENDETDALEEEQRLKAPRKRVLVKKRSKDQTKPSIDSESDTDLAANENAIAKTRKIKKNNQLLFIGQGPRGTYYYRNGFQVNRLARSAAGFSDTDPRSLTSSSNSDFSIFLESEYDSEEEELARMQDEADYKVALIGSLIAEKRELEELVEKKYGGMDEESFVRTYDHMSRLQYILDHGALPRRRGRRGRRR